MKPKAAQLVMFILAFLTAALVSVNSAQAASEQKVLFAFGGTNGANSTAPLIFDANGNLFGTTDKGGNYNPVCAGGCGTVFELSPVANGKWTEKLVYRFCSVAHCTDGRAPVAGLTFDASGNLYGTTSENGGTVFQLRPGTDGKWTETVLHEFKGKDGSTPAAGIILDASGSLYGTASGGGSNSCSGGCGTVFKLSLGTDGVWTETVLYAFNGNNGSHPHGNLVFDGSGNLYGTTSAGSTRGYGNVFKLTLGRDGKWREKVLRAFSATSGPSIAGLMFDSTGNLYGTTSAEGGTFFGSVFRLAPCENGKWTNTVLHTFQGKRAATPLAGVILDAAGNLYGTTGAIDGSVFELSPGASGTWKLKILHSFNERMGGNSPFAGVTADPAGNLYGTTFQGGHNRGNCSQGGNGCGVVFEVTP